MEDLERHKAIHILFRYIDDYEGGRKFVANEFINYFENVLSHLKLVRDQNNLEIIKGVDDTLVSQYDKVPFTSPSGVTDLRYFTVHILATFFPVLIPMAAQFQESYRFCLKLRRIRSDLDFMELELVPHLFDKNVLKRAEEQRYYFLSKVAEMQNLNNDPMILDDPHFQSLDQLQEIQPSRLILALRRRQLRSESRMLLQDKGSPEYRLLEYGVFLKMADSNPIYRDIIYKMGYLTAALPFTARLKKVFLNAIQFIAGIAKVPRYSIFIFNKSRGNFIFFAITIILILIIMISIFNWISDYNDKKIKSFEQRIESLQ